MVLISCDLRTYLYGVKPMSNGRSQMAPCRTEDPKTSQAENRIAWVLLESTVTPANLIV